MEGTRFHKVELPKCKQRAGSIKICFSALRPLGIWLGRILKLWAVLCSRSQEKVVLLTREPTSITNILLHFVTPVLMELCSAAGSII